MPVEKSEQSFEVVKSAKIVICNYAIMNRYCALQDSKTCTAVSGASSRVFSRTPRPSRWPNAFENYVEQRITSPS
jgi:hypothetical protein